MVIPAWSTAPPDYREKWLQLLKTGDHRERSMAIEYLGFPNCRTKEGIADLKLLGQEGLRDLSPLVRETALARLRYSLSPNHHGGCKADDELVAALLQALHDPSPRVREESLRVLGITKTDVSRVITGITPLLQDSDFIVRQQAALALGRIGDQRALPYLLSLLPERKVWQDVFVQQETLYAIRKIIFENIKTYLYQYDGRDEIKEKSQIDVKLLDASKNAMIVAAGDPWLRSEAFEFFASVTTPAARIVLQSASSDPDPSIRKLAFEGLTRIDSLDPEKQTCGFESVRQALKDPNPAVRLAALGKLPGCRKEVAAATLSALLVDGINDANPNVSTAAVGVAPSVGGMEILHALVGKLGVEPYEARKKVMEAFLRTALGDKSFAAPASTGMFAKKRKLRLRQSENNVIVTRILEGSPPARGGHAIVDAKNKSIISVSAPPEESQQLPVKAASEQQENSLEVTATTIVLQHFASLPPMGKVAALEILENLHDPKIKPFAISLLNDPQPRILANAINLAATFGTESILPQLASCARHKESDVRYTAVRFLVEAEHLPEAYSLVKLVDDSNPAVRLTLTSQIQQYLVRHDKLRPDLKLVVEKLLSDPDFEVRQAVTSSFRDVFDKRQIKKLAEILVRDGVCSNAAYALAVHEDIRGMDALYAVANGACDKKNDWRDKGTRLNATKALRKGKDPRAVVLLCSFLARAEGNEPYDLILELGLTADKNAAQCLISFGKKQQYGRVLMLSLRRLSSPEALNFLKESLDTYKYDSEVWKETIAAIAATHGIRSLDILIDEQRNNTTDPFHIPSTLASRAYRDHDAFLYLLKKIGKEQQALGRLASALGYTAGSVTSMKQEVMTLVDNKDRDMQVAAVIVMGTFHDDDSWLLLKKLAASEDRELAVLAEQSLKTHRKSKLLSK